MLTYYMSPKTGKIGVSQSLRHSSPFSIQKFLKEWKWWISGALISTVCSFAQLFGLQNLRWNLQVPSVYTGDELFSLFLVSRINDGWINFSGRSGYPFGSNLSDFPSSDNFLYLILKFISIFTQNSGTILNVFLLLGFVFTFIASYASFRYFNLNALFSFAASFIFNFLPYHFDRLAHSFLTWYFVVPLYLVLGHFIFEGKGQKIQWTKIKSLGCLFLLAIIASSGVYYTLFGCLVIFFSATIRLVNSQKIRELFFPILVLVWIGFITLLNVLPTILYRITNGANQKVASRSFAESEIYGFKLVQLFLPRTNHRVEILSDIDVKYTTLTPLVNENSTAALGAIGAIGLVVSIIFLFLGAQKKPYDASIIYLARLNLILILFGVIGGFGSIFAMTISSQFRAWNRISIYVAFLSILFFFYSLTYLGGKFLKRNSPLSAFFISMICFLGFLDQVPKYDSNNRNLTIQNYKIDKDFVTEIEKRLNGQGVIYQLPYMPFPEVPPLYKMDTYSQLTPIIISNSLISNVAGMKGREVGDFYERLSLQTINQQIEVLIKMGFDGIYLDKRGYADAGVGIADEIEGNKLMRWKISRLDGQISFYGF